MTCILELNDASLCLYSEERELYRGPGMAMIQDPVPLFGEPALRLSRIHPRQSNQQYLGWLNADPLPHPTARIRNHADLVYLHMQQLKPLIDAEESPLLLAVPGVLSTDQLGVLLGILQEVGIDVSGFVDSAAAAAAGSGRPPATGDWFHIDVLLQRTVVTTLAVGTDVSKRAAEELGDCGLARLLDGWVDVIADRFVRETRFDPLHSAHTEQQLYNQIYDLLQTAPQHGELAIEIVQDEHRRRVELNVALLDDRGAQRFRGLADLVPAGAHVLVGARSARLPGLLRALREQDAVIAILPPDALVRGCLMNREHLHSPADELRLVTRLPLPETGPGEPEPAAAPAADPGTPPQPAPGNSAAPMPTHALAGARAWALNSPTSPLPVRFRNGSPLVEPGSGVSLNGEPVATPRALAIGDRLSLGERDYLIIQVEA